MCFKKVLNYVMCFLLDKTFDFMILKAWTHLTDSFFKAEITSAETWITVP